MGLFSPHGKRTRWRVLLIMGERQRQRAEFKVQQEGAVLYFILSGEWTLRGERPNLERVDAALEAAEAGSRICFDADALEEWDTGLLIFVKRCIEVAGARNLKYDLSGLPASARDLAELSLAVPEQKMEDPGPDPGFFSRIGLTTMKVQAGVEQYFVFLGQLVMDLSGFARGRSSMRRKDFFLLLQATGPQALPIVSLLSFLTGLIIAFIGVVQLQKFAADIYVADLVGLAITRELGVLMVGVIMAGRTGAAFAAQIGSMRVNQEIDALTSFGISPIPFLVVPRVLALVLMMPLLTAFADLVAILGGMVVAVSLSDVTVVQYWNQVEQAVGLNDFMGGIFKSVVFGVIIALAGCYRGLNCGNDATSVGLAATSAVVTAITWIVVADAIFAVLFNILGI